MMFVFAVCVGARLPTKLKHQCQHACVRCIVSVCARYTNSKQTNDQNVFHDDKVKLCNLLDFVNYDGKRGPMKKAKEMLYKDNEHRTHKQMKHATLKSAQHSVIVRLLDPVWTGAREVAWGDNDNALIMR